jgi:dihydrofolate reductase
MAARARNGCIGRDNDLPWRLPGDLQYFKRVTRGKPVIMGRRTWESLKGPLPQRTNIVITGQPDYRAEGVEVVASLGAALVLAEDVAAADDIDEVVVIGGAGIFRDALPRADRVYMTEVQADVEGDTFFPALDERWLETWREDHRAGERDDHDYSFVLFERKPDSR